MLMVSEIVISLQSNAVIYKSPRFVITTREEYLSDHFFLGYISRGLFSPNYVFDDVINDGF